MTTRARYSPTTMTSTVGPGIHAAICTCMPHPQHYTGERSFSRLHLPTRRLTVEQIVWHLIQEHGVQPGRPDWHQVLWRHETWFRDTQRTKPWPYDPPFNPPASS